MGKKKQGSVCNNPVAMARASGPPPVTGPTIRDYLARDRPSLEEATAIIQSAQRGKGSGSLAAYEEQMNDHYKEELRKQREKLLGGGASSSTHKGKKKKRKGRRRSRERSRSRSSSCTSPDSRHSKKKSSKRKRRHRSHSPSSDESDSDFKREKRPKVAATM